MRMKKQVLIIIDEFNRRIKMHKRPLPDKSWESKIGDIFNIENKNWKVVEVCDKYEEEEKNEIDAKMTFTYLDNKSLFEKFKF